MFPIDEPVANTGLMIKAYSQGNNMGQIVQMNLGFPGLQFSFELQQSNMSPIYKYLGAEESALPLLWLAGMLMFGAALATSRVRSRVGARA